MPIRWTFKTSLKAEVYRVSAKNGEVFPVEAHFSRWEGTDGYQFGTIMRDISVRKLEAERIRYLAEYDLLTGLANRNTFHEKLGAMISSAHAAGGNVALLIMGSPSVLQVRRMERSYRPPIVIGWCCEERGAPRSQAGSLHQQPDQRD